jgi:hypothetical protein
MTKLSIAVFMLLSLAFPARAQFIDNNELAHRLLIVHHERIKVLGLLKNGWILQIFATDDGETFTLVFTNAQGRSRVIGAGENLESILDKRYDGT